jgi:hypothetical protein
MFHRRGRRLTLALVATAICALAITAAAFAAGAGAPQLVTPGAGNTVKAGKIRLVVKDTSADARQFGVFAAINHRKNLNKFHQLASKCNVNKGCDFIELKRWSGHPGMWTYTARFNFPGYWATTAGRYYWQADHVGGTSPSGHVVSAIRSFRVAR